MWLRVIGLGWAVLSCVILSFEHGHGYIYRHRHRHRHRKSSCRGSVMSVVWSAVVGRWWVGGYC